MLTAKIIEPRELADGDQLSTYDFSGAALYWTMKQGEETFYATCGPDSQDLEFRISVACKMFDTSAVVLLSPLVCDGPDACRFLRAVSETIKEYNADVLDWLV